MRISIVTPSYNQGRFLEATLRSVLDQDYPEKEYIVIDGGSTDGSVQILGRFESRLAYWCSEKDQGQSHALKKGFDRATGDVLCWLNSDDVLLPGALSTVADYFSLNPDVECVSGGGYYIDADGAPLPYSAGCFTLGVRATYDRLCYYEQDGVFQPATFWRRDAYVQAGGIDPSLRFIMDRDLFTRLARRTQFGRIPRFLACFRVHEDSKSSTMQDVRWRETMAYRERYGVMQSPAWKRFLKYYRYRIPALAGKIGLQALRLAGILRLEAVNK